MKSKWKSTGSSCEAEELRVGQKRLVVHHYIGYPPEQWFASCYGLFEQEKIAAKDLEGAKAEATEYLKSVLQGMLEELEND